MSPADLLRRELPGLKLTLDKPYRELTTRGVGGVLPVLAEPSDETQLSRLLKLLKRKKIPFFILGGGSNLVGMDDPYPGVGVRLDRTAFGELARVDDMIRCGAMARLPALASFAAKEGLSGFAALSAIPGCVGGALRMNASCRGVSIGGLVRELRGVRFDGTPWSSSADKLKWRYREGGMPKDVVITSAEFRLSPGRPEEEYAALEAERAKRRDTEPSGRSAGCVFRNVSPERPAGMLIDRCGLRGSRIGGVEVSDRHANYIVNASGTASEADFLTLARLVRRTVMERFGCELQPEVRFVSSASAKALSAERSMPGKSSLSHGLIRVCRWMFRMASGLAALTLAGMAWSVLPDGAESAAVLLIGAVLLLSGEIVCTILNRMEKR